MRATPVIVLALLLSAPAYGGDDHPNPPVAPPAAPAPAAPPAKPAPPLAPEKAADAVLAAVKAKDDAGLKALAARDEPDPWLVADELARRGEHAAAGAFARATPRFAVEGLAAYVASRKSSKEDPERRKRLEKVALAAQEERWADALAALGSAASPMLDVVGVRLEVKRGEALRGLKRDMEASKAFGAAAEAAERMGWLWQSLVSSAEAAGLAAGAPAAAKEHWTRAVRVAERGQDPRNAGRMLLQLGTANERLGDPSAARAAFERGIKFLEALGDRDQVLNALFGVHTTSFSMGDLARAKSSAERARSLAQELGNGRRAAGALLNLGILGYVRSEFAEALVTLEQARAELEALGDDRGVATALGEIGSALNSAGSYAKAIPVLEKAREAKKALGDAWGAARTLAVLGGTYRATGDIGRARAALETALAEQDAIPDRPGYGTTAKLLAMAYATQGDLAGARILGEKAVKVLEAAGAQLHAADASAVLGTTLASQGERKEGAAMIERAIAKMEAAGMDASFVSRLLSDLGVAQEAGGDLSKALATQRRALAAAEKRADPSRTSFVRMRLGNLHRLLGEYSAALEQLERVVAQAESSDDAYGALMARASVANVWASMGAYAQAKPIYEQVLKEMEGRGDERNRSAVTGNLGVVYSHLDDLERGLALQERVLALREGWNDQDGMISALLNIGIIQQKQGSLAQALKTYERALLIAEGEQDSTGVALALSGVGAAQRALGDLKGARAALEKSVRTVKSGRATPVLVGALEELAQVYLAAGEPGRALASVQQALRELEGMLGSLGEEEGASARENWSKLYEVGALAAAREKDPAEMLAVLESGRAGALLDSLGKRESLRWKAETLPEELRDADLRALAKQKRARAAYDRALSEKEAGREKVAEASRALDEASDEVRAVNARIEREVKRAAGLFYPRASSIEQVKASLREGEALVLYGLCLDEALALVVQPGGERIVALGAREAVEEACEALDVPAQSPDAAVALDALRHALVEPLALGADVRQVIVSPEGPLGLLPFGALFDIPVAMTPSGTTHVLLREEAAAKGEGVLALGDPDYAGVSAGAKAVYLRGRPLAALPATRAEATSLGTKTLLGAAASEDGLRAALSARKRWHAVHFACHGLVDPERPTLSSLALSRAGEQDGFLTALEVVRMQIPADLTVLSACETGKGKVVKSEGIVGLTRAFMYAGTPRVICSLWKVDDEATSALMRKFYELWNPKDGKPGLPTAEALKQAQEFVKAQEKWKHPYYWAAWVLWGLPD